jgi:hypothetical protein
MGLADNAPGKYTTSTEEGAKKGGFEKKKAHAFPRWAMADEASNRLINPDWFTFEVDSLFILTLCAPVRPLDSARRE